ncbi:MAG: DHA2 family efflux MFS transporter permease subunit [Ktedonobacteraceae bacterium]|nr:DHA2 family efflux MFS transporter permease subunit [Ktedonobacteraceae bacterium]
MNANKKDVLLERNVGRRLRGFALFSVIAALMLTLLLEALDQTVVGTAMPRIIGQLQGFDRYTWVVTVYLLASTTMIPLFGKLSDQFGRKWFLLAGTVLFLLGSVLSGASQTMDQLIIFRGLQGLGAGIGIALVFTVIGDIFAPAERARWQGLFGAVYGFANLAGPTLGGWLTDHGPLLGSLVTEASRWRWVFYINLPVGIIALAALFIYLPADIFERSQGVTGWAAVRRIDFVGALLAAAATICLLLGLTWGSNQIYSWNSPQVIGILAAAVVLYILFVFAERRAVEPILPLDLFRNRVFTADMALSLFQSMALLGLVIYLPLFLQGVLGVSATSAGAAITPLSLTMVIGSMLAGFVIAQIKRYQIVAIVGALTMTAGVFLLTRMTAATSIVEAIIYMVIAGLGLGTFFSIIMLVMQNALPRRHLGVGTAATRYIGQLGGTLGIAIVGTVVNLGLSNELAERVPASVVQQLTPQGWKAATDPQILVEQGYRDTVVQTAKNIAAQHAAASVPAGPQHDQLVASAVAQAVQQAQHLLDQVFVALKFSLATAIQHGMIAVLVFAVLIVVASLFLKDLPMTQDAERAEKETEDVEEPSAVH